MSHPPLRVVMLGAGTVGQAVIGELLEAPERFTAHDGRAIELCGVAVRDLARARAAGVPSQLLTDAPAHLVADPETDVIVEVMGGDEPARTLIAAALGAGKAVVTANKHVVAHHGPELESIARRTQAPFRFEAAVAGGIPILGPLAGDLAANAVIRVRGIVNGTTNHILTAMSQDGRPYAEVLADAQELGYAEADPTGDVEGDDAVNKLVILARLAFGRWLDPATVGRRPPTLRGDGRPGITGVTDQELEGAAALGLTLKLLATAAGRMGRTSRTGSRRPSSRRPCRPTVRSDGPTASPTAWRSRRRRSARSGSPGRAPVAAATSSAVLGDLVAVARGVGSTWAGLPPAAAPAIRATDPFDRPRRWFAYVPVVAGSDEADGGDAEDDGAAGDDGGDDAPLPALLRDSATVAFEDGTAVRTPDATLADVRAAFAAIVPDGVDVTLYPVDD